MNNISLPDALIGIFAGFLVGVILSPLVIYKPQPTTLTPESRFVVQEIRAKDGQWIYTLENINLQSSNELPILTIQTSVGYGYKTGDTLQVLNYNIPKRNLKLQ